MEQTNIGKRLDELVAHNVQGRLLGFILVERYEDPDREYWENIYIVASKRDDAMTHQANLDSEGDRQLINGNYDMSTIDALIDMMNRAKRHNKYLKFES